MRKIAALLIACFCLIDVYSYAQKTIKGKITDSKDGSAISGATIQAKGTTLGTTSDDKGEYQISLPASVKTLVFSALGFTTVEFGVDNIPAVLSLKETNPQDDLDGVVVVGYGTRLKRDMTSSIAKVTSEEFANLPLPSVEQALQGRASGVFINSGSGKLGQGIKLRVRGISSISANQQPFVVIDGVPVVNQAIGSSDEGDNPLATINPDDIESIEVLKDAASSAIYGSRASNGVLLITTKSGRQGKSKVSAGVYTGWSTPTRKGEFLNAAQYRELFTAAAENIGEDAEELFADETGTDDWNSTNDTKWSDYSFQNGYVRQYNASISGGDAKTKFLISANYNDQKGIVYANRLNRASGRINIEHSLNSIFKLGTNIMLNQSYNYAVASDNAFSNPMQLNAIPPIQAVRNPDGTYNSNTLYYNNLLEFDGSNFNLNKTYRTISNAFVEARITPKLVFRSQAGIDFNNLQEENFLGANTLDGAPNGYSYNNQVTAKVFTNSNTLTFNTNFSENDHFDVLIGLENQKGTTSGVGATGRGFPNAKFTKIESAAVIVDGSSTETEFKFISYFARANYKLFDKYLISASFRRDGSSRFGANSKYGNYSSVSLGWILSEENFLNNSNVISLLKLRGSYGLTGNAEIGNFSSRSLYVAAAYYGLSGLITSQIGDNNLKWETTNQADLGLDFGLFDNRITGELDVFSKKTKDLLFNVPTPAINGYTVIQKNVGDMTNKGIEATINALVVKGKDFSWRTSFNISTYKNKITRLTNPVSPSSRTMGRLAEGQPFGQFYGLKYMGVDPANGDALYMMADGKTTNNPALAVDTVVGNPNPKYYGGWGNRFTFKAFDLDIQTQFVKGGDIFNIAGMFQSVNGDYFDNQTVDQMNYWKKPGDITNIPQPRWYESNGYAKSSRWVQDGSYFRVKSVNLGYNVPKTSLNKLKIESLRIYVAASNLFTFTKYTGYDPEVNTQYISDVNLGHDFYTPPQAKTITVGVNVGL
ncbi:SusC/RagA family TonB-linked outer membrane protein [Polluticaenibacter yanchengensis]|uniref:TonB-dependent receptor n=1 Tax=Polluticaenibacter yanchengensis TaxID=3014562 RepID=A0ABT4UHW8_9BACT|nr:TonB-dependent receptor [Chitinophagaceae bacterium LY-5]